MVRRLSKSDGIARVALPEGREWSGGHPDGQGVIRRLSQLTGSSRTVNAKDHQWSEGPFGGRVWLEVPPGEHLLEGQEPLLEGREQSRVLPGGPEVIGRPSV